jgi:hypothetical protein
MRKSAHQYTQSDDSGLKMLKKNIALIGREEAASGAIRKRRRLLKAA